ncbi:MFS transporter [Nonomuraea endophytica]|uniref:MFS transporter n=1 Tax=Nonomuraea endophytica TaxID=714136 RepID=UPI001FECA24F|nr:MFS transporter [Nonomuraea endophytica]
MRELGVGPADVQWILDAYILVFAGMLITSGSLSDRFGRRRMLTLGLVVLGVGSLLATFASEPWQLIACRAVMGLGGALAMPSTMSIVIVVIVVIHQVVVLGVEDRERAELVARVQERLVRQRDPVTRGQQPEPVVQPARDLLDAHRAQPGRRRLQRERQPVQAPADVRDRFGAGREARPHAERPVGEQPRRRLPPERAERAQRLAGDRQRLPAHGQHDEVRQPPQQRVDQFGDAVHQPLAVVEHQHRRPAREQLGHLPGRIGRQRPPLRRPEVGRPERAEHRVGQPVGRLHPRQRHEADVVTDLMAAGAT